MQSVCMVFVEARKSVCPIISYWVIVYLCLIDCSTTVGQLIGLWVTIKQLTSIVARINTKI